MKIANLETLLELCRNNHPKMQALGKQYGFKFDDIESNNIIGLRKPYFNRQISARNGDVVMRYLFWREELRGVSPVIHKLFAPYDAFVRGQYMVCDLLWPAESGKSPTLRGFSCGSAPNMIKLFFTAGRTELNAERAAILGKLSDVKLSAIDSMMRADIKEEEKEIYAQTKKAMDALHARHKPQIAEVERLLAKARDKRDAEEDAKYYFTCFPDGESTRWPTLDQAVRAYKRRNTNNRGNASDGMYRWCKGQINYLGHPAKFL